MKFWELVLAVLMGVLANEAFAWQPRLALWILEKAVKRTPEAMQARLREEWRADLATIPGKLTGVAFAAHLLWKARKIKVEAMLQPLQWPAELNQLVCAVSDLCSVDFKKTVFKKVPWRLLGALDRVVSRADRRLRQGAYGASDKALVTSTAYWVKRLVRYCEDQSAK